MQKRGIIFNKLLGFMWLMGILGITVKDFNIKVSRRLFTYRAEA